MQCNTIRGHILLQMFTFNILINFAFNVLRGNKWVGKKAPSFYFERFFVELLLIRKQKWNRIPCFPRTCHHHHHHHHHVYKVRGGAGLRHRSTLKVHGVPSET